MIIYNNKIIFYNYLPLPIFAESRLRQPVEAGNVNTPAPASPVTRTQRLMKRPTAQQGGASMEGDCRDRHNGHSVSIININITAIDCLLIVYFRTSRSLRVPPCSKILNTFHKPAYMRHRRSRFSPACKRCRLQHGPAKPAFCRYRNRKLVFIIVNVSGKSSLAYAFANIYFKYFVWMVSMQHIYILFFNLVLKIYI